MPVGYLPDLFGHVGQMPQIWRQFGLDNTILWRGFGGPNAGYWWDAPDGSRLLMMHLPPEGYCNATRIVFDPDAMMARATEKIDFERGAHTHRPGAADERRGPRRAAHGDSVADRAAVGGPGAARRPLDAARLRRRRPERRSRQERPPLDTIVGELRGGTDYANLLPGVLSARVYLKQQNAHVQTLLESYAEPLSVMASHRAILGKSRHPETVVRPQACLYPAGQLRHAWKTLLQNHPHDSICGCSIDAVHEENMTRFARARQVGDAVVESALDAIADAVPAPSTPGVIRAVVVNTTDAVEQRTSRRSLDRSSDRQRGAVAQSRRAGPRPPGDVLAA